MFKKLQSSIMLLIAAIIWGTAFVAQCEGMRYVEPFTYNALRMLIGGVVLIPVITVFRKISPSSLSKAEKREKQKRTLKGGICCGLVLFMASSIQQIAISSTTAGKAGFITTLYIVIVPLIKLAVFRERTSKSMWFYVLIAIAGFYLLCMTEDFSISNGDLLMLLCAVFFAMHIIVIDYFNGKDTDGLLMACLQFFVSGLLATVMTFIFETPTISSIMAAKGTILYTGLMSSGVAYTLQILGQQNTEPTLATLLMSLESVFAALSGWLILDERLTVKEGMGCLLVFTAVILAQLKLPEKRMKGNKKEITEYEKIYQ